MSLQELKQALKSRTEPFAGRYVTIFLQSELMTLTGSWYWDMHTDAVFCSDVMVTLPVDFAGIKSMIHPEDVEHVREGLADPDNHTFSFRIITSYGEIRTLQGDHIVVEKRADETSFGAYLLDRATKELAYENEFRQLKQLKSIYEKSERYTNTGIWWYNQQSGQVYYSAQVFRIHDLPPFSLNMHLNTFTRFIHPEQQHTVTGFLDKAIREQLPLHVEYRIVTSLAEKFVQLTTQWFLDDDGTWIMGCTLQDLTEQKRLFLQTQETESRNHFLKQQIQFDEQHTGLGHWQVNLHTRKTGFSDHYYRIFGLRPKSITPGITGIQDFIHPDDRDLFNEAHRKMLEEHVPPELDFRIIRNDGKLRYVTQKARIVQTGGDLVMMGTLQDVTVYAGLEKKIREFSKAETIRAFMQQQSEELASMSSWTWDLHSGKITASEQLCRLLSLKPGAEISQKNLMVAIHHEDKRSVSEAIALAVHQQQASDIHFRVMQKSAVRHIKAAFRIVTVEDHSYFIATLQDTTREAEWQESLKDRLRLADALSENLLDRVIITDQNNNIQLWNRECEKLYQLPRQEVIGCNYFDVLPQFKTDDMIGMFNKVLKGEPASVSGIRVTPQSGYYHLHMIPLRNEKETEVRGIIHILHDVTRETELRNHLSERLGFIESLVEFSVDRIIAMDRNLNYLVWNKKCEEYYGLSKEQVIGKNLLDIFPESVHTPGYDAFRKALRGETIHIPASREEDEAGQGEVYLIPVKNERQEISALLWIIHDLSDEIAKEKKIRSQASLLQAVLDASLHGIVLLRAKRDHSGRISHYEIVLHNSSPVGQRSSLLRNLAAGSSFRALPGLLEAYDGVMRTGEPMKMEICYHNLDRDNWYLVAAVRLDEELLVTTIEDITEQKLAEAEIKKHQDMLQQTTEATPDAITIYDLEKKIPIYLNNCLSEWTGFSNEELVSMGFEARLSLIHPEDRKKILAFNEGMMSVEDGVIQVLEYRLQTRKGLFWIRNRAKVFKRDAQGIPTHMLSVLQDFTEEVKLRDKLMERTQYAEAIIDASMDRIAVYDKDLKIIAWNRKAEQMTGFSKEVLLGKQLFTVFPEMAADQQVRSAIEQAMGGRYMYVPPRKSFYAPGYFERFYIPLQDENKNTYAVLSLMHDVTDLVQREEELKALNHSLEEKTKELERKNEEVTHFSFVTSHDLREPLRKIHSFSEWLLQHEKDQISPMGQNFLHKMRNSVLRIEMLIDDILVLTQIHSDRQIRQPIDLNLLLEEVKSEMAEQLGSTETIIQSDTLPVIHASRHQIWHLFRNLISNAIKFQKPGNQPQIKITAEQMTGETVSLDSSSEAWIKISFQDNGFGFDSWYAEKIFQVFQRLHDVYAFEGTGIGLAICKKIMENHEGHIEARSEPGNGSVFSCYFPVK